MYIWKQNMNTTSELIGKRKWLCTYILMIDLLWLFTAVTDDGTEWLATEWIQRTRKTMIENSMTGWWQWLDAQEQDNKNMETPNF